jgi:Xaa-Pro dipeptidase
MTYDMVKQKLTLFIPPIDPDSDEVLWSGMPMRPAEASKK